MINSTAFPVVTDPAEQFLKQQARHTTVLGDLYYKSEVHPAPTKRRSAMTGTVDAVESMVAKAGFELDRSSVSELSEQGVINRVFTAATDAREVVVHVGKRLDQDTASRSKPRIYGVSEFLRETEIPRAEVITTERQRTIAGSWSKSDSMDSRWET